jgi:hypothetical protein
MPRLRARGEAFEILYEYKRGDMDIGEAYDLIYDEIMKGYGSTRKGQFRRTARRAYEPKKKRKLSAWNKFVKANSRKKEFRYRDGKLNLKKMGVAFRRKKRR